MRVAIYSRVSTDHQARTQSIEAQVERLVAQVAERGWDLQPTHRFRDNGYSGANLARPGLDALRQAVRAGEVDRVLITTPDRLARNYVHQVLLLQELEATTCQVEFLDRPMSKDPNDQLMLQVRGAVAEFERALIAQRTRHGKQRKLEAGLLLPWSVPPYGYRVNPDRPTDPAGVSIDEVQASVVREIHARYLADGGSIHSVVEWLNASAIPSPGGKVGWHGTMARRVLTNPTYAGRVCIGRVRCCEARQRRSPLKGSIGRERPTRAQPANTWVEVARVPAIISEEGFAQVQAKLAINRERASRNNKRNEYLLRALVSCGVCQSACICTTAYRSQYSYYRCGHRSNRVARLRGEACQAPSTRADALDALVWEDLCSVLMHPECIDHALQRAHGGHWEPQELQARRDMLRKGKAGAQRQMERLTDAYLGSVIGLEEYSRRRGELEEYIRTLEHQEGQLASQVDQRLELAEVAASVDAFCERVQAGLSVATFSQKRQLVELLIDRVVVTGDDVEIRYVIPTTPASESVRFCHLRTHHLGRLLFL